LARRIGCGSGYRNAVNESERSLSIWAAAWRVNATDRSGSPGCEIELEQVPKGSTVRHYFDMARIRRRHAEFNLHRKGFDGETPIRALSHKEFTRRELKIYKMKSL
jgi:hypothetical protein